MVVTPCGLLHSEICGSKLAYSSPQLIAVNHVLLRLPMPRHSPCALVRFTFWNCSLALYDSGYFNSFYPTRFSYAHISARFVSRVAFVISRLHYFVVSSFLHYTCYSVFKVPGFCSFQNRFEKKILFSFQICFEWWAQVDSNHRPHAYQACALTC